MGARMGLIDAALCRVVWPLWSRRDHPLMLRYIAEISRRQFDSDHVRTARRNVMLQRIVEHALATVPYYRDMFARLRLSAGDIRTEDDLQLLPILTKTMIREQQDGLKSVAYRDTPTVEKKTSGSTGVPLQIALNLDGLGWKRAATIVADEWSGWRRGQRIARVWGDPGYGGSKFKTWLRNTLFDRAIQLNTLGMTESDIVAFARRLPRYRPSLIFGHAHSVALLASVIRDHDLPRCHPEGIITTAMVLHDYQRKLIEAVFGCRVTNRYGCEEVSLIACECPTHSGLHVNDQSVLVEILDGNQRAAVGKPGRVVITDLSNFAMPLLRYEVGDVASWSSGPCVCGRGSARLAAVEGREADYVVTASGEYISGISLTDNFATLVPGVTQMQFIQETTEQFCFRIVRGCEFSRESEPRIAGLVRQYFGPTAQFRCEFLDQIPQEPSGKYRFCISHVTQARRAGRAA
ncbi:MAG: phenylacetate--CoA ligase family protein [Gemmataceae bacterium]